MKKYILTILTILSFTGSAFSKATFSSSYNHTQRFLRGITLNSDGTTMYFSMQKTKNGSATSGGDSSDAVDWITLSTANDLSSANAHDTDDHINVRLSCEVNGGDLVRPGDMRFNNDGTKVFITNEAHSNGPNVCQMELTTAYDASTIQDDDSGIVINNTDSDGRADRTRGLFFNSDGSKMFVTDFSDDKVYEYALTTNFELTSNSYTTYFDLSTDGITVPTGLAFSKDGKQMFVVDQEGDEIHQWTLTTGFDLSSASTYRGSLDVTSDYQDQGSVGSSAEDDAHSLTFNADGSKLYVTMDAAESNNTRKWVLEYDLDCPYGVVYCESPISGSDKDIIGTIEAYTEQSKRIVKNNIYPIMHRLEWLRRHRKENNLTNQNLKFNFSNEMVSSLVKAIPVTTKKKIIPKKLPGDWFVWSEGLVSIGETGATVGSSKKETNTSNITIGVDKKVSENKMYGYAFQFGRDSADVGSSAALLDTDNYSLAFYGTIPHENEKFLDGVIGVSALKTKHVRKKNSINLTGERNGKQFFSSVKYNKIFNQKNIDLNPTARIDLGFTELSTFSEKGSNDALIYEKHQIPTGMASVGMLFSESIKYNNGKIIKHNGRLEYIGDFSPSTNTNVSYVTDPSADYFISIGNETTHNYRVGYGFDLSTATGWSVILNYERHNANGSGHSDNLYFAAGYVPNTETKYAFNLNSSDTVMAGIDIVKNIRGFDIKFGFENDMLNVNKNRNANISLSKVF